MQRRKVALWGAWHVHAEGYLKTALEYADVVGVYDADPERRKAISEKYGVPAFASEAELLSSPSDGVLVCTATAEHPRVIAACAKAGKDIFTEKVLAVTETEAEETAEIVRAAGVSFVISFPDLYTPWMKTARELVETGKLGKVTAVRFKNCHTGSSGRWLPPHFYSKEECGGGAMIDLGAHGMYVIASLLGIPACFKSCFTCVMPEVQPDPAHPVEDNAVTLMTWDDGTIAICETGFVTAGFPKTLEITGTAGSLYFWNKKELLVYNPETKALEPYPDLLPADPSPLVQFLTKKNLPGCGIDEAVRLTKMMVGAYKGVPQ